jgi:hypothetical protein
VTKSGTLNENESGTATWSLIVRARARAPKTLTLCVTWSDAHDDNLCPLTSISTLTLTAKSTWTRTSI